MSFPWAIWRLVKLFNCLVGAVATGNKFAVSFCCGISQLFRLLYAITGITVVIVMLPVVVAGAVTELPFVELSITELRGG